MIRLWVSVLVVGRFRDCVIITTDPFRKKRYFCRDLVRYFGKGYGKVRLMVLGLMLSKRAHINFAESDTPYRESARQSREKRPKIRAKNSNSIQIQITLGHW